MLNERQHLERLQKIQQMCSTNRTHAPNSKWCKRTSYCNCNVQMNCSWDKNDMKKVSNMTMFSLLLKNICRLKLRRNV
ncbi:hypothetical protein ACS0TY_021770 [Phlomoides rotata]